MINVKELYLKWLLEQYNVENSGDELGVGHHGAGDTTRGPESPSRGVGRAFGSKNEEAGQSRPDDGERSTATGEQGSHGQSEQDLRDKELIKAYLFKRLGRMAEESGKLETLRKHLDEALRNRI